MQFALGSKEIQSDTILDIINILQLKKK